MIRTLSLSTAMVALSAPAFAADDAHGDGGFIGGLKYAASDPVTFAAFMALVVFLAIVWRLGAFKTVLGSLDERATKIQSEIDEAKRLREEAAEVLAAAERRQQDADAEADAMVKQAKEDAKRIMEEARKDMAERLARREALAEARIARAEAEAADAVRKAAADAATEAARRLLAEDTSVDQFETAASEIERALS